MRIAIGADHAGFRLKEHLVDTLRALGHEVNDFGTDSDEPVDYPPICASVARAVASGSVERGIVLGGSGQGEQIAANKIRGIRAALCNDLHTARLARQHNDANVVAVGARMHSAEEATAIVEAFLAEPFSGAARHQRRIDQLAEYERTGRIPEAADVADRSAG